MGSHEIIGRKEVGPPGTLAQLCDICWNKFLEHLFNFLIIKVTFISHLRKKLENTENNKEENK